MKANLFGTDGIRSPAGAYPLDESSLLRLGAIIADQAPVPRVLIGRDTRESGPAIEALLGRGLGRRTRVFSAGVLPTPGLAYLTRAHGFGLGVMISASHNPFADNGIKLFDRHGEKASAALEARISRVFLAGKRNPAGKPSLPQTMDAAAYENFLRNEGKELAGTDWQLAADCANGAASRLAPALFQLLGLRVAAAHFAPDGRNINAGCGSTFPAALQELVASSRANLGLAFDGDADRVVFADAHGRVIEGDHVLFHVARLLRRTEPRFKPVVVGTVMSNLGLERALRRAGIDFLRADVGDKHVYRLMKRSGAILGGEPSGHVILRHRQSTGDGLLTALYFMRALRYFRCDAAAARDQLILFPQQTLSIRVRRRPLLEAWEAFQREADRFARRYGRRARLLARYSGTEPKLRIMIEARDPEIIDRHMPVFQRLVENEIGE
ncbi:MAG: phosphoglucosamine mutase [Acidobacteria bacterium]|jgi:phosphoglucosamine mutase|nr:phosphoglucosamine mutase [Acidobacteriota bacterium]